MYLADSTPAPHPLDYCPQETAGIHNHPTDDKEHTIIPRVLQTLLQTALDSFNFTAMPFKLEN